MLFKNIFKETKRWDIVNQLITKFDYKDYLEIGQQKGQCFREIIAVNKEGLDPKPKDTFGVSCKYHMTSDEFFENHVAEKTYDIIFIDGLHIREQALKDVQNSLLHLKEGGSIVMHDCNPAEEWHQVTSLDPVARTHRRQSRGPNQHGDWNGDVWKAFLDLRRTRSDLEMFTVDTDFGCGIIRLGSQELYKDDSVDNMYSWKYFKANRNSILNLISVEEFQRRFS
tara:strand:- start:482 stop:1156 length:675 start_codon:yes stop_codon:yes gene_type:complete